jgi:RNA polymerase sigma-70 factor, ECF subfamily
MTWSFSWLDIGRFWPAVAKDLGPAQKKPNAVQPAGVVQRAMMSAADPFMLCRGQAEPALADFDDDALMHLASSGQRAAFEVLVRRHQRAVRNVCARLCARADLADDLAQEVFAAAWKARLKYQSRGQLLAYLLTIAVHRCRNAARDRSRHPTETQADDSPSMGNNPFEALNQAEQRQRLDGCMAKLPSEQRQVIALKFGAELDYAQIAEIVGCTAATARSRVYLGIAHLRRLIGKWGST